MDKNDTPKDSTEKQPTPYVSPRLRSKMSDRYEEEKEQGPSATIAVVGLIAVIVICGGLFLLSSRSKKAETGQTADASQTPGSDRGGLSDSAAVADSLAALAAADSLARLASTPTTAAAAPASKPIPKPGATPLASNNEAPSTPAPVATPTRYGIVVGSYLFDDKAGTEKDRLAGATSLEGAVVEKIEGGTSTYQVVLGAFDSRAQAEAKGAELLGAGTVRESRVVPLKRK